jgi:DNA-binding NarL/FixJ family response regulator
MQRVVQAGYGHETGVEVAVGERSHPTYSAQATRLLAKLTRTEFEVFEHLRTDATEKQIARTLNRSPHTVHVHVKSIYRKLGIRSRQMLNDLI